MTIYIGIDPGLTGGIVALGPGGVLVQSKMPVLAKRINLIALHKLMLKGVDEVRCAIEVQHVMPAQGAVSGYTIGVNYGMLLGYLAILEYPHRIVRPQEWQKGIALPARPSGKEHKGTNDDWFRKLAAHKRAVKQALMAEACRRFPGIERHSGICDAALIADWLRRRG